jgi:hypothetical protein
LPQRNDVDKPLYNYEKIIFDSLATQNGNDSSSNKHLWIKKAALCQTDYLVITKNAIMRL